MRRFNFKAVLGSLLMLVGGIFLLVKPGETLEMIVKIVGVVLLIVGAIGVLQYFIKKGRDRSLPRLLISAVELIGGFVCLANPGYIVSVYYIAAGLIILLNGVNNLTLALDLKALGFRQSTLVMILAILAMIAGVVIILNPFAAAATMLRVIGVLLAYDGIVGLMLAGAFIALK